MSYPQTRFKQTSFAAESLLGELRTVARTTTLPLQLDILKATGRYNAFKLEYQPCYDDEPDHWPVPNHLFWDSDIAKWIEGACYFLHDHEDEKIENAISELVEMIRAAQNPDGYLNIHFTVVAPSQRYTNLRDLHELYNAGHLIEAALAHEHHYSNRRLLEPILKYVDLMCNTFGPGNQQIHGYPGHPEIELAFLRLYSFTQDPRHLRLAKYFIDERGNPTGCDGRHFYDVEAEKRGERLYERPRYYPDRRAYWYQQAHVPVVQQREILGHSVRAMYLLTAVADLMITPVPAGLQAIDYLPTLDALWNNMVQRKMSVVGGIGAIKQWEGFGIDYFLPQGTDEGGCYNETCASIGVMMLAERMLQLDLDRKYSDVMELALFNTVLGGMSSDGRSFTYVNQLASSESDPSKREDWFTCACCPPNVTRLLGSLGGYIWNAQETVDTKKVVIHVHLFSSGILEVPTSRGTVKLTQKTEYPWKGDISFLLEAPDVETTIRLRIPSWAESWKISPYLDGPAVKGYLELSPTYLKMHPRFSLTLPLVPRTISSYNSNQNVVAIARGPLIYCIEDFDNPWTQNHFKTLHMDVDVAQISESMCYNKASGQPYIGVSVRGGFAIAQIMSSTLPGVENAMFHTAKSLNGVQGTASYCPEQVQFIPYYLRANRGGRGQMRVGLKKISLPSI